MDRGKAVRTLVVAVSVVIPLSLAAGINTSVLTAAQTGRSPSFEAASLKLNTSGTIPFRSGHSPGNTVASSAYLAKLEAISGGFSIS